MIDIIDTASKEKTVWDIVYTKLVLMSTQVSESEAITLCKGEDHALVVAVYRYYAKKRASLV